MGRTIDQHLTELLTDGIPKTTSEGKSIFNEEGSPIYTGASREPVREQVATELAKRSGFTQPNAAEVLREWDGSGITNYNQRKLMEIQMAVSRHFGVQPNKYVEQTLASRKLEGEKGWDISEERLTEFVGAMYDYTQEQFRAQGLKPTDTVTLYRGITLDTPQMPKNGDVFRLTQNPMSSWSSSASESLNFAFEVNEDKGGVLLKMEVPISNILSSARTGFGSLPECEFLVLGGEGVDNSARVVAAGMDWPELQPTTTPWSY